MAFQHKVVTARCFIFSVNEDPAFNGGHLPAIQHLNRQPLVRHEDAMSRQHFLTVRSPLHRPEYGFEITPHSPDAGLVGNGQPHVLQHRQSGGDMPALYAGRFAQLISAGRRRYVKPSVVAGIFSAS